MALDPLTSTQCMDIFEGVLTCVTKAEIKNHVIRCSSSKDSSSKVWWMHQDDTSADAKRRRNSGEQQ
ncbi:hypothetical protein CBOM_05678 [Ceraceosorus bombacis]|uniref:Uncharacterized protein n=1 Tax=Ceraceosorus bombacis TaxID=401625 RepID=A0A0P1BS09_9BASI|nr:hypothetical protein CBOM_05678 [Ceraceosorus bombacis]